MPQRPPAKRLKVARVIARLNVGGPARQVCFLHERLGDRFDTILITGSVDHGEADMAHLLRSNDGVYKLNSMSRPLDFWADLVSFSRLLTILKRENPDILHTHTAKAGALGRIAGFILGIPTIVHTYHGHVFDGYFGRNKTRLVLLAEKLLNLITTRVVAISDSQARELSEKYDVVKGNKISVIRTGHDLSRYLTCKANGRLRAALGSTVDNKKIVVWAGRMVPIKNVRLLAEIICRANREAADLHFAVVGDGPERALLEHLMSGCTNVSLLGWRTDLQDIWSGADIALGTSLSEGTPASFIEAMACGKPFVSTAVGGIVDLVVSPRTDGDLVVAGNCLLGPPSAGKLLDCLLTLSNDPALAASMGQCGRAFVEENYGAEQLVQKLSSLYQDLHERNGRARTAQHDKSLSVC